MKIVVIVARRLRVNSRLDTHRLGSIAQMQAKCLCHDQTQLLSRKLLRQTRGV